MATNRGPQSDNCGVNNEHVKVFPTRGEPKDINANGGKKSTVHMIKKSSSFFFFYKNKFTIHSTMPIPKLYFVSLLVLKL